MENWKRGQEGFFDKKKGSKEIFRAKKGRANIFRRIKGGGAKSFSGKKKGGLTLFY